MDKRIQEKHDIQVGHIKSDLKILDEEINFINNHITRAGHLAAILTAKSVLEHELLELNEHRGWIWKLINSSPFDNFDRYNP